MMKYLWYEIKKNLPTLLIITGICTLLYILQVSTLTMSETVTWENIQGVTMSKTNIYEPAFSTICVMLAALCFLVPPLTFSFKMEKRAVDCFYALPLKKEKLYLAKTLSGLVLIVVPFTVAYWLGFVVLALREGNPYQMFYYLPAYFGMLGYAIMLFGVNSFLFTRANKTVDGCAFMWAYIWILAYAALVILEIFDGEMGDVESSILLCLLSPGGMGWFDVNMGTLIVGGGSVASMDWTAWMFVLPALFGVAGYFGLFFSLRYEKAENAEQVSDSWFGYKVLIPLFTALTLGLMGEILDILLFAVIAVVSVILNIVYKRTFKLSGEDWIRIGIGLFVGVILALV